MPVEFKSRFLRPCSGTLVLVGKREGSPCGNTLVFCLDTCITNIVPVVRKDLLPANELTTVSHVDCYAVNVRLRLIDFWSNFP